MYVNQRRTKTDWSALYIQRCSRSGVELDGKRTVLSRSTRPKLVLSSSNLLSVWVSLLRRCISRCTFSIFQVPHFLFVSPYWDYSNRWALAHKFPLLLFFSLSSRLPFLGSGADDFVNMCSIFKDTRQRNVTSYYRQYCRRRRVIDGTFDFHFTWRNGFSSNKALWVRAHLRHLKLS